VGGSFVTRQLGREWKHGQRQIWIIFLIFFLIFYFIGPLGKLATSGFFNWKTTPTKKQNKNKNYELLNLYVS